VQINTGGVGFYRAVYPEDMLDALLPGIRDLTMPPRDRLGLQNDLFALVCQEIVTVVLSFYIINTIGSTKCYFFTTV